jgi:putative transcriptional regulator
MGDEKNLGQLLIESMDEHIAYMHGKGPGTSRTVFIDSRGGVVDTPPAYDAEHIRRIRRLVLRVSQPVFAEALNVSRATVRAWEQGIRQPEGPTRRLLEIAESHPEVFREKIHTDATVPA